MRVPLAITSIALTALQGTVNAGPRACAQVSDLVDGAVRPLLANLAEPSPDTSRVRAQFRDCLSSRNICSVVYNRNGKEALVAGDVTADLPVSGISEQGTASVIFLVRSIPRVRRDSNQYCLVSEKLSGAASVRRWDVYGWVIAPNASQALPLPRQGLDYKAASDPQSLRGLAAALWFFAERMSGQPPPPEESSEESPGEVRFLRLRAPQTACRLAQRGCESDFVRFPAGRFGRTLRAPPA
jgi:hypothetical protein